MANILPKKILVNTKNGHNKFWMLVPSDKEPTHLYQVINGRLGTKGQQQTTLLTAHSAEEKLYEKLRNGDYRRCDDREYQLLNARAAIVGTTNKCDTIVWVRPIPTDDLSMSVRQRIKQSQLECSLARPAPTKELLEPDPCAGLLFYQEVDQDTLASPDYNPILLVHISLRKEMEGRIEIWLLLDLEQTRRLEPTDSEYCRGNCYGGTLHPITGTIKQLAQRVEGAMGHLINT